MERYKWRSWAWSSIDYDIIDLTASDWIENILENKSDLFLLRPPGMLEHYKALYDERLYVICKVLGLKTFPSYEECYIYENKRLLSYYLQAKDIAHPQTKVFYNKEKSIKFIEKTSMPIVAKTSIGGSGSGVQIIKEFAGRD